MKEILVKIPKPLYDGIMHDADIGNHSNVYERVIMNGTPLPEHHGDLIDAGELEELFREVTGHIAKKPEMSKELEHMVRASAMVVEMITDAPTVVEATKEDK